MKKITIILVIVFSSISLYAQDQTLVGKVESVNFYISPSLKLGRFNDNTLSAFRNDTTNVYYVGGELWDLSSIINL